LPKAKKEDLSGHNKSVSSKQSILDREFVNQAKEKFEEQEAVIKLQQNENMHLRAINNEFES
jgi:hypothetical protein